MADDALARRMFEAQQRREGALGRRLTLEEIAAEVGAHTDRPPAAPSVVRRWLKGKSEPDRPTLAALAAVFGVDPGWLAFGDAAPPAAPSGRLPTPSPEAMAALEAELRAMKGAPDVRDHTKKPPAGKRRSGGGA